MKLKTVSIVKASTLLVVVFILTFTVQSCVKTKELSRSEMEGFWVLKSLNGQDAKSVFLGAVPTLEFNFQDSIISGTGGCNYYNGSFTYKKGILSAPNLTKTTMLCTEDNAEPQYLLALSDGDNVLSLVNGILTVTNGGKVTLEFEKGTAMDTVAQSAKPNSSTLMGTWMLKNIAGVEALAKFGESIPTLQFDFDVKKISGNAGCNNYNAKFDLTKNKLVVAPVITTRMACPNLQAEEEFTQAIADTSIITLPNENILQFAKNGTVVLEFEKQVIAN